MALIDCPECGKQASSKAARCPHCGYSIMVPFLGRSSIERTINIVVLVLVALFLLGMCGRML